MSIYFFSGYILLSIFLILDYKEKINDTTTFLLTMIPSLIMGTGLALGEATIVGSLRNYPKKFINGWSSGTGMAGIIGALLTLFFKMSNVKTQFLYLFCSPLSIIYLFTFLLQEKIFNIYVKPKQTKFLSLEIQTENSNDEKINNSEIEKINNENLNNNDGDIIEDSNDTNFSLNFNNFKLAFSYSKVFIINLFLVNFL